MPFSSELQFFIWTGGALLAANALAMTLFVLFSRLPESKLKENIRSIIFELDKFADSMENSEKRRLAIQHIKDILGWRKALIPAVLIGWIIDIEVAAIRKMQKSTGTPNLHD